MMKMVYANENQFLESLLCWLAINVEWQECNRVWKIMRNKDEMVFVKAVAQGFWI